MQKSFGILAKASFTKIRILPMTKVKKGAETLFINEAFARNYLKSDLKKAIKYEDCLSVFDRLQFADNTKHIIDNMARNL